MKYFNKPLIDGRDKYNYQIDIFYLVELFVEELCFEDTQKAARILMNSQTEVADNACKEWFEAAENKLN